MVGKTRKTRDTSAGTTAWDPVKKACSGIDSWVDDTCAFLIADVDASTFYHGCFNGLMPLRCKVSEDIDNGSGCSDTAWGSAGLPDVYSESESLRPVSGSLGSSE